MKKLLMLACALLAVGPGLAFATTYYPYTGHNYSYGYGCTNLTSDLSYGSRGGEVSTLQQFLANQNYPGTGSWMVTGYYGRATEAAVRNFQANRGLIQTGVVDWATRSAIQQSCGNTAYPNMYGYSYSYVYQNPYTPPAYYQYGYGVPLRLDSLSISSGVPGTSLTLYGSGFETTYNTVRFGTNAAYGAGSTNGASLTITIPNVSPGVYPVIVSNGKGTSNSLSFTVIGNPYPYYNYLPGQGGYTYGYNYNYSVPQGSGYSHPYNYNYPYAYNYGCSGNPYGCY